MERESEMPVVPMDDREFGYRLAVLTHGSGSTLDDTIEAFYQHVSPAPSEVFLHVDGGDSQGRASLLRQQARLAAHVTESFMPEGFCRATRALWRWVAEADGPGYVVWLEHDHLIDRDVDVRELALELDADHRIAQIALMRDAVNEEEIAAGGLFESRQGAERWLRMPWGYLQQDYFTTNVSVMRRDFMRENTWPDYPSECEGKFGIDLVARGYRFGVWGDGSPYTRHIGVRTGMGY